MTIYFKDKWLEDFYFEDRRHRKIPASLHTTLYRKLQMLGMAKKSWSYAARRVTRSNHYQAISQAGTRSELLMAI